MRLARCARGRTEHTQLVPVQRKGDCEKQNKTTEPAHSENLGYLLLLDQHLGIKHVWPNMPRESRQTSPADCSGGEHVRGSWGPVQWSCVHVQ